MSYKRSASHAGPNGRGWYESTPTLLREMIDGYFKQASEETHGTFTLPADHRLLGVICPHAGLFYSGATAAKAYRHVRDYLYNVKSSNNDNDKHNSNANTNPELERIFILGPSHHASFRGVKISAASCYETPFGELPVDSKLISELMQSIQQQGVPSTLTTRTIDENEHSIEMQIPFISHILHFPPSTSSNTTTTSSSSSSSSSTTVARNKNIRIVPIIVGANDWESERKLSVALRPYMSDSHNLFVFSSDFCHWGARFQYQYHFNKSMYPQVGDSIIALDHEGMKLLENINVKGWYKYLDETDNTICGRHAISVALWQLGKDALRATLRFVGYDQSNKCQSLSDSSVSYAAAVIAILK